MIFLVHYYYYYYYYHPICRDYISTYYYYYSRHHTTITTTHMQRLHLHPHDLSIFPFFFYSFPLLLVPISYLTHIALSTGQRCHRRLTTPFSRTTSPSTHFSSHHYFSLFLTFSFFIILFYFIFTLFSSLNSTATFSPFQNLKLCKVLFPFDFNSNYC